MNDWTNGYVAEIEYTFGYYGELNPLNAMLPLLAAGLAPPDIATACELGFGQGVSVNIHAAASPVLWYGTDFNPAHAAFAQSLAAAAATDARLYDQSFAEFCARPDLPDFDYIGLHGVWSWVSEENRRDIVDLVRRKLKVGGVLYLSYNTQPGFAAMVPLRQLLLQHAESTPRPGRGIVARIDAALDFGEKLLALNTVFAAANPTLRQRLAAIKQQNRNYIAHEYFNRDWHAASFADMAASLAAAKLTYAGSAGYLEHVDALNLTPDQTRFLAEIPDPMFRQSVRDFVLNQQFRRDYWVKGARRLAPLEQAEALRRVRLMLKAGAREDIGFSATGALGPREMAANVYTPVLDALADGTPRTIGEIEQTASGAGLRLGTILEVVMVLAGKGDIAVVQDAETQSQARVHTDRLNARILEHARGSADLPYLASPASGGGIVVPRFQQLFLLALRQGRSTAEEMARFVWDLISQQGQRVMKDGKPLEAAEDNLATLATQAGEFLDKPLTVLRRFEIA